MDQPTNSDNKANFEVFTNACKTGDFSKLDQLIAEQKFPVNEPMSLHPNKYLPLTATILDCSTNHQLRMATFLLERGADPNAKDSVFPLTDVVKKNNRELTQLLLDNGAAVRLSTLLFTIVFRKPGESGVFELVMSHGSQLVDNPGIDEQTLKTGKYARLVHAMITNNADLVRKLLTIGDYKEYAGILHNFAISGQERSRPSCLPFKYDTITLEVLEVFIRLGCDLWLIYLEAIRNDDIQRIDMCTLNPDFNPHGRGSKNETALHIACEYFNLDVIKHLANKYKLDFEAKDSMHRTPVFCVRLTADLYSLLTAFPEIKLTVENKHGRYLMDDGAELPRDNCNKNAALLEFGADPVESSYWHRDCKYRDKGITDYKKCAVLQYVLKMWLIDQKYVRNIMHLVIYKDKVTEKMLEKFLKSPLKQWKEEIVRMKKIIIRQATTEMRAKSLFDFIFFTPNETVRYSTDEVILDLYEKNGKDFRKLFPYYGFLLNRKLQRGNARRDLFCLGMELIGSGCGSTKMSRKLPADLGELVFGHFSNGQLPRLTKNI